MSHVLHERTARPSAHTHIVAAMTREARSGSVCGEAWTDRFDEREACNCGKFRAAGVTKVSDLYDWKLAKNANQPYPFEPHMDTLLKYTLSCGCL